MLFTNVSCICGHRASRALDTLQFRVKIKSKHWHWAISVRMGSVSKSIAFCCYVWGPCISIVFFHATRITAWAGWSSVSPFSLLALAQDALCCLWVCVWQGITVLMRVFQKETRVFISYYTSLKQILPLLVHWPSTSSNTCIDFTFISFLSYFLHETDRPYHHT